MSSKMLILTEVQHKMVVKKLTPVSELDHMAGWRISETYAYQEEIVNRVGLLHIVITSTDGSFIDLGAQKVIELGKSFYYGIKIYDN